MQGKNCLNEQWESLAQSHVEMNGERASLFWESLELVSTQLDPVWQMRTTLVSSWLELDVAPKGQLE